MTYLLNQHWPGICAVIALVTLLVFVIRYQVHAFAALLVVSLGLGLAAGLPPAKVIEAVHKGVGDILREVVLLLALGALLGRLLETSGAAELIARRLINVCGEKNTSFAIAMAAFIIGIPIMFNVGFLLLIPIVWRLQRETKRSLLYFLLPLAFSLGITHSLVPPHPGIIGAVQALAGQDPNPVIAAQNVNRVMIETIVFGVALSLPLTLLGWFGPGRWWAQRQFVIAPENMGAADDKQAPPVDTSFTSATTTNAPDKRDPPIATSFALAMTIILAPLLLSLIGFGASLMKELHWLPEWMTTVRWLYHSPIAWLEFLGKPTVALFVPTVLAFWCYGLRRGWSHAKLAKLTDASLLDVGGMIFLFGAAGGFKEVIQQTGVGGYIAEQMMRLPVSPVALVFIVAALMRIALGSATASIMTASALLADFAKGFPGQETMLVLSVACGVTVGTQPADSGFWMIKQYGNMSSIDVMLRFNACRLIMALTGLGILLCAEMLWR